MIVWQRHSAVEHGDWDTKLATVIGANFFQTTGWGTVKASTGWGLLKLVALDKSNAIVAMALVLFRRQPVSGALVWIPGGVAGEPRTWGGSLQSALKRELMAAWIYIRLNALGLELQEPWAKVMQETGWSRPRFPLGSGTSLEYCVERDEPTRLRAMSANWRHNLKRSRKYNLRFERWSSPNVATILMLYRSMESHKGLLTQVSEIELKAIFQSLGESVVLYKSENAQGEITAIRACALFNGQAFDLLAAAGPEARRSYASYGLLWALINECYAKGVKSYDLGGVELTANKGVYDFKHGIGSNLVSYLGEWESASPASVKVIANMILQLKKWCRR